MASRAKETAKLEVLTLRAFKGLDLRRLPEATEADSMIACSNISVGLDGVLETRDPLRKVATLDAQSKGLYVVNGELRAVLPYPDPDVRPVPRPPVGITYDLLTDSDAGFIGTLNDLASFTAWQNKPYVCVSITTPNGVRYRHYYPGSAPMPLLGMVASLVGDQLTLTAADPAIVVGATVWLLGDTGSYTVLSVVGPLITLSASPAFTTPVAATFILPERTRVNLPFEPGSPLLTAASKVFAPDSGGTYVWGSSTEFGPTDWVAPDDSVAIPTSQHAGGDLPVSGLGIFQDKMVVFYERNAQFWTVDPFPDNIELASVVGGAGTRHPGSIANVQGDLFYFGDGTFRSMSAVVTTGQPKEGDQLGSLIAALTKTLAPTIRPASVWSSRRQQYLCAFGAQIFAFTMSEVEGSVGWGRWDLPFPVSHLVESKGIIYCRRADAPEVYAFDPLSRGEVVAWSVELGGVDCGQPGTFKRFSLMDLAMSGSALVEVGTNPSDLSERTPIATIGGTTVNTLRVPILVTADHIFPRFSGSGPWRLDQFVLRYRQGGFA